MPVFIGNNPVLEWMAVFILVFFTFYVWFKIIDIAFIWAWKRIRRKLLRESGA
jgi:hypothetical protein